VVFQRIMEPPGGPAWLLLLSWVAVIMCDPTTLEYTECTKPAHSTQNFFQFKIDGLKKNSKIDLNHYNGNIVLAVNVATF
jgi:hypothetical protein